MRMQSNWNCHTPQVGMLMAQTEWAVSYRVNIQASNPTPKDSPNFSKNVCFQKKAFYTNVYSDFIHNHQKLEENPNAFLLMNDKVSYILTVLLSNEQSQTCNLDDRKCISLSERSQFKGLHSA